MPKALAAVMLCAAVQFAQPAFAMDKHQSGIVSSQAIENGDATNKFTNDTICDQPARLVPNDLAEKPIFSLRSRPTPAASRSFRSKSRAILGGAVSKLDQIRLAQSGAAPFQEMEQAQSAIKLEAKVGTAGQNFHSHIGKITATRTTNSALPNSSGIIEAESLHNIPAISGHVSNCNNSIPRPDREPAAIAVNLLDDDAILGSKAISIRSTPFDASWSRISKNRSTRRLRRALVSTGANRISNISDQVARINAWVNQKITYAEDQKLYGKPDYWATARQTLSRRAGDCEDIAIVKMDILAALGVSRNKMRLVIARDLIRNADHAILVVSLPSGSVMLDNNTDMLLDARLPNDYRPIMSFTKNSKSLHGYAAARRPNAISIASLSVQSAPQILP